MNILIMGSQGSGKSTQAELLAKHLKVPFVSTGELIRQHSNQKTNLAKRLKVSSEKGELVNDNDLAKVMDKRLSKEDAKTGFILDGYPRRSAQLSYLNSYLLKTNKKIDRVFYLDLPIEEGLKRLKARARSDDTNLAIKRRLQIFHQDTLPIIEYFKKQNIVEVVDGRLSINEIHNEIINRLKKKNVTSQITR